jgi:hypothetical protein
VTVVVGLVGLYFGYDGWIKNRQKPEPNPFRVTLSSTPPEKQKIGVFKFTPPKEGWLPQWGDSPPNVVYGVTPGMDLGPAKGQYRFVLIARIEDATVDQTQDETIEKSAAYTISNETSTLAIPVSRGFLERVAPQHMVYVSLVILPTIIEPKQIRKLADVEKFGGGILATNAFLYKVVTNRVADLMSDKEIIARATLLASPGGLEQHYENLREEGRRNTRPGFLTIISNQNEDQARRQKLEKLFRRL